ncbi:MAG: hypothetical protein VB878_25290 [Pirellulaceae bacterium]
MPLLGIATLTLAFAVVDLAIWRTGANLQTTAGTAALGCLMGQLALLGAWTTPVRPRPTQRISLLTRAVLVLLTATVMAWFVSQNDSNYKMPHLLAMLGIYVAVFIALRAALLRSYFVHESGRKLRFHLMDAVGWCTILAIWLACSRSALADEVILKTLSFAISAALAGLGWSVIFEGHGNRRGAVDLALFTLAASTLMLQSLSVADNRLFASAVGQAVTLFVGIIAMRIYEPQSGLMA